MDAPTLKAKLDQALKAAMLSKEADTVSVIRGLKSAITYQEVADKKRDDGLNDAEIQAVLAREAKKRAEAAEVYRQVGDTGRSEQELSEKEITERFLPASLGEDEIAALVDKTVSENPDMPMGQVIGAVKAGAGPTADGSLIARLVKERLAK